MRWLREEPLAQFLLIGAGLFALHWAVGSRQPVGEIRVTPEQVATLAAMHSRTWERPPTRAELEALVDDWIRGEVAVREARAQGLDKEDPIIKRRLRQKMEFLAEEPADQRQPTAAQLQAWLSAHPERYSRGATTSFQQVALDPSSPKGTPERRSPKLLALLNSSNPPADPSSLGDGVLLLAPHYEALPAQEVRRLFGAAFATALARLRPGGWVGPIPSGFGAHLVRIQAVTPGAVPPLAEVREAVELDWRVEERRKERDRTYRQWLGKYHIERPALP
ncbi:MAG: peptidyl-prolyl cis-trans isomerase [Cyanobium sp.]